MVQLVWTNMHGFFLVGPVIVLVGLFSEWIKRRVKLPFEWNDSGRLSDVEYRRLLQIFMVAVLACLINPYFLKGAWYPLGILFSIGGKSNIFFSQIQELQRTLRWETALTTQPYFPYKLLILVSLGSFLFNYRKIDVNALIVWIVLLVFSLSALRNIVFFAFASYFAFLSNFQYIASREIFPVRWNSENFRSVTSTILKVLFIFWILQYGNGQLLRGYYDCDRIERPSAARGVSLRNFPYKAADFLVDHDIKGNFFNDFNSGAYLIGRAYPNVKVFIDGRTEAYGADFFKKQQKIWEGDASLFEEAVNQYQLTGAFLNSVYVPAPEKFIRYLYEHPQWILVYFDYDAAIFLKDHPENRTWIDRFRIDLAQWQVPDAELLKIGTHKVTPYRHVNRAYALYNMGFSQKALEEAAQALRIEPDNTKANKLTGKIFNERGEYAAAFESLRKAKLTDPQDMKIRFQIAFALFHLGEIGSAKEQCLRVLAQKPKDPETLFLIALIYAHEFQYDRMMSALMSAHRQAPEMIGSLVKIGELLMERKEFQRAHEVFRAAVEIDAQYKGRLQPTH
jgi:tetratricopeptide (TPR) repeat protein